MPNPSKVGASATELQRIFNRHGFYRRMQDGEFTDELFSGPSYQSIGGETVMSEMRRYRDASGAVVAVVHQYRRHDGSLAASGMPDPKLVVHDGVTYTLQKPNSD